MSDLSDWIAEAEASEQQQFFRIYANMRAAIHEYENWFLAQLGSMGEPLEADEIETMREDCLKVCASAFTQLYPGQRRQ